MVAVLEGATAMPMLEGRVDAVIGVDTHRDRHAAALLDPNGGVRATLEVPSDQAGHARLLRLAQVQAPGRRVWALEGTGCYGAGLTRFLVDQGEWVVEIDRPKRPRGRHGAKSDGLDAIRAGREALAREHLTNPRQRGHREALRVLHSTRAGIVQAGADARRQLKALIVTAPEPLRDRLRGRPWRQQVRACAALVAAPSDPVEHRATVRVLVLTAQRVLAAHQEAKQLEAELRQLIMAMAPALLAQPGIGPVSAAQLLISWSHPGRFRSEAAFAMLAGAAPVEASSGQVVRHRLNRGGDRQLNRALHTIVMLRQVHHGPTRAYTSRRISEGKSQREIRRCLKRTVARQLYRLLERTATNHAGRSFSSTCAASQIIESQAQDTRGWSSVPRPRCSGRPAPGSWTRPARSR
jgi:transposase